MNNYYTKKMLGWFNQLLGQKWTNPVDGLKKCNLILIKNLTQPWVCPYFTKHWVKATHRFLESIIYK